MGSFARSFWLLAPLASIYVGLRMYTARFKGRRASHSRTGLTDFHELVNNRMA